MNIPKNIVAELQQLARVKQNEPLCNYTTFKTGGPADMLVEPRTRENIASIIRLARDEEIPLTVIGGGSNLLIGDAGIRGITVRICTDELLSGAIEIRNDFIYCDACVPKADFIQFAVANGYGDIAFMAGIPGVIGGGIFMNAGTSVGSFIDILKTIEYIDPDGNSQSVDVSRNMSSYRQLHLPAVAVVTGAFFSLRVADPVATSSQVEEIIAERWQKHPMQYPSAGSVFKNPEGHFSWKLVNDAGLKGAAIGGARVSELHTNFIINIGGAQSRDIRDLIELIQEKVLKQFGIRLETEIKMLGEF